MNIVKQEIKEKARKLKAHWTVTLESKDSDISKEVEDELARTIQEEIDWEIMCDMMVKLGYTKIEMKWPDRIDEVIAHNIKEWCRENLQGHYQGRKNIWLFADEKDAVLFSLRWA